MKAKILEILREVLDDNSINESISQINCEKWDSLRHLNIVISIENEFNVSLEPEEIAEMKSFENILRTITIKKNK